MVAALAPLTIRNARKAFQVDREIRKELSRREKARTQILLTPPAPGPCPFCGKTLPRADQSLLRVRQGLA